MLKKPSFRKPGDRNLQKVAMKHKRLAKAQRARFIAQVGATVPTEATEREAGVLVERVRAAKSADFLQRYRIAG